MRGDGSAMAFESESTWRSHLRRGSRVDTDSLRRGRKRGAPRHPERGGGRVGLGSAPKPGRVACYPPPMREPASPSNFHPQATRLPSLVSRDRPLARCTPPCVFGTYGGNLGRPGPPRPAHRAWRLGPTRGGGSLGRGPEGEALFHLRIYWAAGGFPGRGWARAARGARAGSIALARSLSLSLSLAAPSGSQSASAAAARGAARGGRSHIRRRRRPPTSPSDSAAPGGFEFWLPGKGPFLGERGLSFVRLRPLRAPLQAPPRPACARDCASALTAPFICLWSRRAAPEAGDPAVSCSRGRRRARMTRR